MSILENIVNSHIDAEISNTALVAPAGTYSGYIAKFTLEEGKNAKTGKEYIFIDPQIEINDPAYIEIIGRAKTLRANRIFIQLNSDQTGLDPVDNVPLGVFLTAVGVSARNKGVGDLLDEMLYLPVKVTLEVVQVASKQLFDEDGDPKIIDTNRIVSIKEA